MKRVPAARLATHYSPHGLRHSFASLALQEGKDVYYICRMLGHASIQETVDTYARWLPANRPGAPDSLDPSTWARCDRFRNHQRTGRRMTSLFRVPAAIVL
jgi:integrase